tara:strand:+ start:177 stop:464 length:288 start_codon:yes stop_codon:yes gene_type:complete
MVTEEVKLKAKKKRTANKKEIKPITNKIVKDFVGDVKNHHKTEYYHIADNRYRINVWTVDRVPDRLVDTFTIDRSYYAALEDGTLVDKTIRKESE